MSHSIQVSNIAPATTATNLNDFFTFCGKITSVDFNEKSTPKSAVIHFEKPSAANTALMLNGGTLDGYALSVHSDKEHVDEDHETHGPEIEQSDKPRAGIAAEYLAKGYTLSDGILQRAIELDQKRGISKRFLEYFNTIDSTLGSKALGPDQTISGKVQTGLNAATQQARSVDEQKGISKTAADYYTKAITSPFGQKVRAFYTTTTKQVLDIHEEARRIADQQKPAASTAPPQDAATVSGAPGVQTADVKQAPTVV